MKQNPDLLLDSWRFYQSARARWVNLERIRTKIENEMIDELAEWSMYIYPAGVCSPFYGALVFTARSSCPGSGRS